MRKLSPRAFPIVMHHIASRWYRLDSISASLTLQLMFFHMYLVMLLPNRKQGLEPTIHTWQLQRRHSRALGSSLVKWNGFWTETRSTALVSSANLGCVSTGDGP